PDMLRDWAYWYELVTAAEIAAEEVGDDGTAKDRMIYAIVPHDCASWARLGEGKDDRPLMTQIAYLLEMSGFSARKRAGRQARPFWPIRKTLVDNIAANGGIVCWWALLENLTKQQSVAAERALFEQFGLRRFGGLFENDTPR